METVIIIRSLVPGGAAQLDGRLVPGDRLMFVNDARLENASLDEAVQALKGAPRGRVLLGVAKPLPLPDIADTSRADDVVTVSVLTVIHTNRCQYVIDYRHMLKLKKVKAVLSSS